MVNFSVDKKVIIVTGVSSGNGLALSTGLVEAGAIVVGIDKEPIESTNLKNFFKADITNKEKLDNILKTTVQEFGIIDGLVNNAGISIASDNPYDQSTIEKTLSVNLNAALYLSWKVAEKMKENNKGSIVKIFSLGANLAFRSNKSYQLSKAGLLQLTKSMTLD